MKFTETCLPGVFVIEAERQEDERGLFARTYCQREFSAHGLNSAVAQCSISYDWRMESLRGLHCQESPHGEAKLVQCTVGTIYDVILDLRPGSSMFKKWIAVELSAENRRMVFIPEGLYHKTTNYYVAAYERGCLWNDPSLGIDWPVDAVSATLSDKDQRQPRFSELTDFFTF